MTRWFVLLCLIAGCGKLPLESVAPTIRPGDTVIVSDKSGGHLLMAKTERELLRADKMLADDDDRIAGMLEDDRARLIKGRHTATVISTRGKSIQLDMEILDYNFKPITYRGYALQSQAIIVAATPELSAAVAEEFEANRKKSIVDAKQEAVNPGKPGDAINVTGAYNHSWRIESMKEGRILPESHRVEGTRHGAFVDLVDGNAHIIIDLAEDGEPSAIVNGYVSQRDVIIEKDDIPLSEALQQAKLAVEKKATDE